MAAETLVRLRKVDEGGYKATVEVLVVEWSDPQNQIKPLTNYLELKILQLHTMPRLAIEAARMWTDLDDGRKYIERRGAKLASWEGVGDEITVRKKEVTKLVTSVTPAQHHHFSMFVLARTRGVKMELLWE